MKYFKNSLKSHIIGNEEDEEYWIVLHFTNSYYYYQLKESKLLLGESKRCISNEH